MKVSVHLVSQSKPIEYPDIKNTYTKDGLFCLYSDGQVEKYPLVNIFPITESY